MRRSRFCSFGTPPSRRSLLFFELTSGGLLRLLPVFLAMRPFPFSRSDVLHKEKDRRSVAKQEGGRGR